MDGFTHMLLSQEEVHFHCTLKSKIPLFILASFCSASRGPDLLMSILMSLQRRWLISGLTVAPARDPDGLARQDALRWEISPASCFCSPPLSRAVRLQSAIRRLLRTQKHLAHRCTATGSHSLHFHNPTCGNKIKTNRSSKTPELLENLLNMAKRL